MNDKKWIAAPSFGEFACEINDMLDVGRQLVREEAAANKEIVCQLIQRGFTFDKPDGAPGGPQTKQIGEQHQPIDRREDTVL